MAAGQGRAGAKCFSPGRRSAAARRRAGLCGRERIIRRMADSAQPGYRAWLVVALLFPVALLNYLDRQMLATMGISIKADFAELQGASGAENFGRLMSVFMWIYAIC